MAVTSQRQVEWVTAFLDNEGGQIPDTFKFLIQRIEIVPRIIVRLSISVVAVTWLAGCSGASIPNTIPVSGKVTYKGQPVGSATVTFVGEANTRPATALTSADGTYSLMTLDSQGALAGNYRVTVDKTDIPPELRKDVSMEEAAANANKPTPEPKKLLPAKYSDPKLTPLKFEVKAGGAATFDIQLTDE